MSHQNPDRRWRRKLISSTRWQTFNWWIGIQMWVLGKYGADFCCFQHSPLTPHGIMADNVCIFQYPVLSNLKVVFFNHGLRFCLNEHQQHVLTPCFKKISVTKHQQFAKIIRYCLIKKQRKKTHLKSINLMENMLNSGWQIQ